MREGQKECRWPIFMVYPLVNLLESKLEPKLGPYLQPKLEHQLGHKFGPILRAKLGPRVSNILGSGHQT